jgi:hypothetical protein
VAGVLSKTVKELLPSQREIGEIMPETAKDKKNRA